jgi:FKBP-type peptidyl-prolyl cis-trans isomerase FkpA
MKLKALLFLILSITIFFSCKPSLPDVLQGFTKSEKGYYYKLIQIGETGTPPKDKAYYWLDVSFKTLKDSVFWDSKHEGADKFFVKTQFNNSPLSHYLQQLNTQDSAELFIPTATFFKEQFGSDRIPFFSEKDSLVKICLRVKQVLGYDDWILAVHNFENKEQQELEVLLKTEPSAQKDSLSIVWLKGKPQTDSLISPGKTVTFSFQGTFLDGRLVDAQAQTLSYKVGTPDQVLKGINYVIRHLKKGESTEIILPSHLAFGETGSSNGSIPPFTSLAYTLTLIDVN